MSDALNALHDASVKLSKPFELRPDHPAIILRFPVNLDEPDGMQHELVRLPADHDGETHEGVAIHLRRTRDSPYVHTIGDEDALQEIYAIPYVQVLLRALIYLDGHRPPPTRKCMACSVSTGRDAIMSVVCLTPEDKVGVMHHHALERRDVFADIVAHFLMSTTPLATDQTEEDIRRFISEVLRKADSLTAPELYEATFSSGTGPRIDKKPPPSEVN